MSFQVVMADSGASFRCRPGQNVLEARAAGGGRCIPVGCRGGGCGVCRVRVIAGDYRAGRMSVAAVNAAEAGRGVVLACQLYPLSDLRLERAARALPDTGAIRAARAQAVMA